MAKKVPPSKKKYDKVHPIISLRVDAALKAKLDEIRAESGKSVGDILREAVGVQAKSVKKAHQLGYSKARLMYRVIYHCKGCGGTMEIASPEEKEAAARYMRENRWGHTRCL